MLVLSETEEDVLGPVVRFSRMFVWVVLLTGLVVVLLTGSQIRRSLVPLVELREGTRRIAQRDFASRVSVASRDEFEELAASFNTMAAELGRQFHALSTAAELDRAVLSATDVGSIVDTLLARTRDVFPCHLVGVTLVAPDGGKSLAGVVYDYCDEVRHSARVELHSEDVQDLLDGPDLVLLDAAGGSLPAHLDPLLRLGPRSLLVLPLRFRRQLVGILAVGHRTTTIAGADEQVQLRRLADQVAVALANAQMLEQVKSLAYFDSLTGLPNRLSYKERLARALDHARHSGKLVAAFFIDLDHFSRINDTSATRRATTCPAGRATPRVTCRDGGRGRAAQDAGARRRAARRRQPRSSCPLSHPEEARAANPQQPRIDPRRRPGDLRQRQHRDRHLPRRRRRPRDAPHARRHGDVQGEGAGREQLPGLLADHERDRPAAAHARERPAPRARAVGVRAALPADRRRPHRRAGGRRGAAPVAPSGFGLLLPSEFIPLAEENGRSSRSASGSCSRPKPRTAGGRPRASPIRVVRTSSRQPAGPPETVARILRVPGPRRDLGLG
jgi:HAMP domain-containing protein